MLVCNISLRPRRSALTAAIAAGTGDASGIGADAAIATTIGTASGISTASGVGVVAATGIATGAATGTGAASGVGVKIGTAAGTAAGTGTATGAAPSFASFNGATSNVTLSNGNLTVTHSAAIAASGARSTSTKTTGKYYFEFTWTLSNNSNDGVGLLTSAGSFASFNIGTNCFLIYPSGNIYVNGNTGITLSAITAGTVICFAVDLTARKGWIRKGSGNWNNNPAADPATGANGLTLIATVSYDPAVGFGGAAGSNFTANFGATAFAQTAPSGFGTWPA